MQVISYHLHVLQSDAALPCQEHCVCYEKKGVVHCGVVIIGISISPLLPGRRPSKACHGWICSMVCMYVFMCMHVCNNQYRIPSIPTDEFVSCWWLDLAGTWLGWEHYLPSLPSGALEIGRTESEYGIIRAVHSKSKKLYVRYHRVNTKL